MLKPGILNSLIIFQTSPVISGVYFPTSGRGRNVPMNWDVFFGLAH